MKNLDKEYTDGNTIYEQQKEYRATPEGKFALRRAKERQILKKMNGRIKCNECDETRFEVLNVYDEFTLCYNCRYQRPIVFSEEEMIW